MNEKKMMTIDMNRLLTIVLLGLAAALAGAIVTLVPRASDAQGPAACGCAADEASCADCEHCAGEGCAECAAGCEQCAGEGCEQCADGCDCAEGECDCAEGACDCAEGACEHGAGDAGMTHGAANAEPSDRIAA